MKVDNDIWNIYAYFSDDFASMSPSSRGRAKPDFLSLSQFLCLKLRPQPNAQIRPLDQQIILKEKKNQKIGD